MSLIPEGEYVRKVPGCFDESVIGFPSDIRPSGQGVKEMLEVISILEDASIPCCVVAEAALIYFGAGRMMDVSILDSWAMFGIWLTNDPSRSGTYVFQPKWSS